MTTSNSKSYFHIFTKQNVYKKSVTVIQAVPNFIYSHYNKTTGSKAAFIILRDTVMYKIGAESNKTEEEWSIWNREKPDAEKILRGESFFFRQPNAGQGRLILEVSRSNTQCHLTVCKFLRTRDRPVAETSPLTTQNSQETEIHVPGGIRTLNTSKRSASDPRLKVLGHWDQQSDLAAGFSTVPANYAITVWRRLDVALGD